VLAAALTEAARRAVRPLVDVVGVRSRVLAQWDRKFEPATISQHAPSLSEDVLGVEVLDDVVRDHAIDAIRCERPLTPEIELVVGVGVEVDRFRGP